MQDHDIGDFVNPTPWYAPAYLGGDLVNNTGGKKDKSSGLTPAMIEALKRQGYNQSEIGEMFGITRGRVSQIKYQATRFSRTARERAMDIFPFRVPKEPFQHNSPDKRLRDHAEYMISGGKGMSQNKLRRLGWFYNKLRAEGLIVVFDKSIPPSPGIKYGGYGYVERTAADDDYIVRFNEDTQLTEEERLMWRFPPVIPEV